MTFFNRNFKAAWWSLLLTLVGVTLFVGLGLWQLQRADLKQGIEEKFAARLAEDYQRFDVDDASADIEYKKLIIKGRFDNNHHLLIDNKINGGKPGYQVLTPFLLVDSDRIMLVNRGWVALGESRQVLPEIVSALQSDQVYGIASLPDTDGYRLGKVSLVDNWPQVIPYIDMPALQAQFSEQLLPVVLWMSPEQPDSYHRAWDPVWSDPEKSRAYAVQWFSFAFIACVLFVLLNLRKK
ncbi:MAG: surfeit locus 1 family protein [Planctomycetota bacterium]|jgi:surfeit locus 1 family protein